MSQPHGVPVLEAAIPLSQGALDLVKRGVATLWSRISTAIRELKSDRCF